MSMRKTMSNEYWVIGFCGDEYEYRITKWCLMRESGLLRDEYKLLLGKNKCTLDLWNDKYELSDEYMVGSIGLWSDEPELGLWNYKVSAIIIEWYVWVNYGVMSKLGFSNEKCELVLWNNVWVSYGVMSMS